ncbi:MAG: glutamate--tRNA ligase [Thermodesulfobacteriota bacterium]
MKVRTRFGPSPTGELHMGGLRTALFNFLFARHASGAFILRIEDTDRKRSSPEFERAIIEDLKWLGLDWEEGPVRGGEKGPYRQSERFLLYKDHAEGLLEKGLAYRCYCTDERLERLKRELLKRGLPPRYDGRCVNLKESEAPGEVEPALRFRVAEEAREISFTDLVHGPLTFDRGAFGDFIILSSDGAPSYNFAVVLDDALMGITHVIRGDDHLPNTPRQILLCEALGYKTPLYCHIPLVLAPDRKPLGKRHGNASVKELKAEGFLPVAILNAAARLGWSPGEGLLSLDDMAVAFTPERLSKSPSIFDIERLRAFNKKAMEGLGAEDILRFISPCGKDVDTGFMNTVIEAVRPNAVTLKDIKDLAAPFIGEITFTEEALKVLKEPHAKKVLRAFLHEIEKLDEVDAGHYNEAIEKVKKETGEKGRRLFMPLRSALTGAAEGIELQKVFTLLCRESVAARLKEAIG